MKSVPDFIPDHVGHRDVLILGMNPSTNTRPIKNGTFARLQSWMKEVGVPHWDFHNVVPNKTGEVTKDDVDWKLLEEKLYGNRRKVIICLGQFVRDVMTKSQYIGPAKIIKVDHPSPRNRNFNDPSYESQMLKRLKKELKDADFS